MGFTTGQFVFSTYLRYRQYTVLKRPEPPAEMKEVIDDETFKKTQEYGRAKLGFSFFSSTWNYIQNMAIFQFDIMPKAFDHAGRLLGAWAPKWFIGAGPQSIVTLFMLTFAGTILDLPTSLYETFVLEEKFGFNKQTIGLFFTDLIKGQLLTIAIGTPLMSGILKIINYFGDSFFYYLWLFMFAFQIVAIAVYPTLIQPLFNKLTPLEDGKLKESIEGLARKVKFPLTKIYVIDGSKRSAHSNAYFYGLPWSKQIVIYDTLIDKQSVSEVTAVLAHEIGHWAQSHIMQLLGVSQVHLFSIFALFSAFVHNNSLYESFGFHSQHPILIGFIIFNDILQPVETFLTFAMNLLSRKFEYEADAYAVRLEYGDDLAKSLVGLHKENLSSVDADWLYSSYHHSHPILPERLHALRLLQAKSR
jgi:STE24 endopeptidase